ncbi:alpha,alpha-trehalase Nth1 [Malassezia pachydermatis]|uniref:Trehalase n=1 Tax=Malassezia pachydermatis TaxID=77020 RepID=A0A0M9VPB3_9BASI|nr:glycoside hydrolase family 37 protein [Malassezia pachydermatis]KOS14262.1 glycoside hydrolase family 37 protein [Malassezia pachydermatis]
MRVPEPELETLAETVSQALSMSDLEESSLEASRGEMPRQPSISESLRRAFTARQQTRGMIQRREEGVTPLRRLSADPSFLERTQMRQFSVDVDETMERLLAQEDTDGDHHISIIDTGPKAIRLDTVDGDTGMVRGTYMLSNLLQELALAKERGEKHTVIDETRLAENPVDRLSRMIRDRFWDNLTRTIDADGLERILSDPKNRSAHRGNIIYVPENETHMIEYYRKVASERPNLGLVVDVLPSVLTPGFVRDLNKRPGLVALAMKPYKEKDSDEISMHGIPFVVPGARFNELYNWDSYFIALGLLEDGRVELARGTVDHFVFEIQHYNKIMNGNRSYYLLRSQPPFLTDYARRVYYALMEMEPEKADEHKVFLYRALCAAIKEYFTVWMCEPRYHAESGLSRYHPEGLGVPPETEASHFTALLHPYAERYGCSINEFTSLFNRQKVEVPELDEYFRHDRAVRESGHDTSYRLERRCANLLTIDLQSLLYKYEIDIAELIREVFNDSFMVSDEFTKCNAQMRPAFPIEHTSQDWFLRARHRRIQVDTYLWNEGKGLYYDYDIVEEEQSLYESVTAFWAMWSGLASQEQADRMMRLSLKKFEVTGGLVPGTEESRGPISLTRPNRQWDYPYAWPPHQMLAWEGMKKYGYMADAQRLAYRWLYMMITAFVDFNGVVPEKFDAVALSHLVNAEYGNQGTEFSYVPREGFGWMNASFQVGLTYMTPQMRNAVAACQHPDDFFARTRRRSSLFEGMLSKNRRRSQS